MLLPYDIFYEIIKHADIATLLHLYYSNTSIQKICLSHPFMSILLDYKDKKFNPYTTSTKLDTYLQEISGNDLNFLKQIQLIFGSCLSKKCIMNKIIILDGFNGKTTFLKMLHSLLGDTFSYSCEPSNIQTIVTQAMGRSIMSITLSKYNNHIKIIVDTDKFKATKEMINNSIIFTFRTIIGHSYHCREMFYHFSNDKEVMAAFLNFLLKGCKEYLEKMI